MKHHQYIALLAVLIVLPGCSREEQTTRDQRPEPSAQTRDLQERYKDAAVATKEYVAKNKDEFVASMDKKLKELDGKITDLAKQTESYKDDAKLEADKALATLREQRQKLSDQFEQLKQSSADAWTDLKARFESAMGEVEKTYDEFKAKFKKQS
jgi:PBP1b-binding outer membrane lipoprotein LpoB